MSGILPRFFATGKPLSQGYLIKMKIGDVFPPRSGFVQQSVEEGLANPLRSFANLLTLYVHLRDESLKKASNLAGKLVNEAVRKNVINLNKFGG